MCVYLNVSSMKTKQLGRLLSNLKPVVSYLYSNAIDLKESINNTFKKQNEQLKL